MLETIIIYALAVAINVIIWIAELVAWRIVTCIVDVGLTLLIAIVIGGGGTMSAAASFIASLVISIYINFFIRIPDVDQLLTKLRVIRR